MTFIIIAISIANLCFAISIYVFLRISYLAKNQNFLTSLGKGLVIIIALIILGYFLIAFRYLEGFVATSKSLMFSELYLNSSIFSMMTSCFLFAVFKKFCEQAENLEKSQNSVTQYSQKLEEMVEEQTQDLREKEKNLQDTNKAMLNILQDFKQEKEKLATILYGIGEGVVTISNSGYIELLNPTAEKILNIREEEVIGKKFTNHIKFFNKKIQKEDHSFVDKALEKNKIITFPSDIYVENPSATGPIYLGGSVAPIEDRDDSTIGAVIVFSDISEEKEIEHNKTEFVSFVSHQLRTPLTGMKWFLELLQGDGENLTDEQRKQIQHVHDSNIRLINLVNDLLDMAKIENTQTFKMSKTETDISQIIHTVIEDNMDCIKKRDIKIINHLDHELLLNVDAEKIHEVFHNIISNAIKYCNSQIEIDSDKDAHGVTIIVNDDGIGIPESEKENMFKKFFRATNTSENSLGGTGLGLYISKIIVEAHEGKIWFESIEGKGSTFYFTLPN